MRIQDKHSLKLNQKSFVNQRRHRVSVSQKSNYKIHRGPIEFAFKYVDSATSEKVRQPFRQPFIRSHPPLSRSTNLIRHKEQSTMLLYVHCVLRSSPCSLVTANAFKNMRRTKKTIPFIFSEPLRPIGNFNML